MESIPNDRLREFIHQEAMTIRTVKTRKTSTDSDFAEKVRTIRDHTHSDHNPPIVVAAN